MAWTGPCSCSGRVKSPRATARSRSSSKNERILLSDAQQQTYNAAMRKAEEGGPCCCHCWRWTAFEGQAKYFIARRHYTARQIGTLWGLDDGCGDTSGGMVMTG